MFQIGVIGSGKASEKEYKIAEQLGKEIVGAGHFLICGGLGGVMEAASKGARSKGGLSVGILPGSSKEGANQYIDIKIVTDMSHGRNAIISNTSDVLIAVGGGPGTLSEISLGLKIGKPIVVLDTALPTFIPESAGVYHARSPGEALALAEKLAQKNRGY
jgi:uncharacterized protein (TIGR00725 family)